MGQPTESLPSSLPHTMDPSTLSIREMKELIAAAGLDTAGCLDKDDLIQRCREAMAHGPKEAPPTAEPPPPPPPAPPPPHPPPPTSQPTPDIVNEIMRHRGDPYGMLGLAVNASDADLKKAFRLKCLKVHPDKCPHPSATTAFQLLNDAFASVSEPGKRAAFDATRSYRSTMEQSVHALAAVERERDGALATAATLEKRLRGMAVMARA